MADASGTPTSPDNIPTYNTGVDPPSGKGFNTAMAQIQAIFTNLKAGTLASGKIAMAALNATGTPANTNFLRGDGTWTVAPTITTSTIAGGPPASPKDGDIWIATGVDANGTRWQFQYNAGSASTYKWEFIGGSSVLADVETQESTVSTAAVDLATVGPQATLARGGDYEVTLGAIIAAPTATAALAHMRIYAGGVDTGLEVVRGGGTAGAFESVSRRSVLLGRSAGDAVTCKYFTDAGTGTFGYRHLVITPKRVS
jgi:hypothetical protein